MTPATFLALAALCAPTIHPDTSVDIAKLESGFNQYAIGVVGQNGIFPKSLADALSHVDRLKAQGKNYSVGLMQINQSNFKKFNTTAEKLFNPCNNLSIYEKIITDCYTRGGTLKRALSCYYSGNFDTGQRSEKSFGNTSYTQRIGYVVPSTKADKAGEAIQPQPQQPSVIYPSTIIRGALPVSDRQITAIYPDTVVRGNIYENLNKGTDK
jgi:type IV secretion system protein VirB1